MGVGAVYRPAAYLVVVIGAVDEESECQGAVVAACYGDAVCVGVWEDSKGVHAACVYLHALCTLDGGLGGGGWHWPEP